MSKGLITALEATYIRLLLEDPDAENKKSGLQRLCKLYRSGLTLQHPHAFRQTLIGLLYNPSLKVRRWALNAIALLGRRAECLGPVLDLMERDCAEPEILVSSVPALFAMCTPHEVAGLMAQRKLPIEGPLLLASAQFSKDHQLILAKRRIIIEQATPLELRMASLLIGFDKAPEHLLSPRHPNSAIIGDLNGHDDDLVAQYSIWAITENPILGLADLRVRLKDIESLPANVRGWLYRLIAADAATARKNLEYIVVGSEDQENEAREGLAIAIRNTYFDGLDETVFAWLPDEPVPAIKDRLLEHMAAHADRCEPYERPVIEHYRDAGGLLRSRLEVASQRTGMYGKLRRIAISNEQASLDFGTPQPVQINMVQQNINTGGGSIGVVSGEGTVIAQSIQAVNTMAGNSDLKGALGDLLTLIEKSNLQAAQKKEAADLVTEVATKPTRTTLGKLTGWLKVLIEASVLGVEASHVLPEILQRLHEGMALLPG